MSVQPPAWVAHAVFYQIFPDRFARSPRVRRPAGLNFKPWGSPPEAQGFQGGDLLGIVDRLDHLEALGATALYLNPVFASAANHRYHTFDYFHVDPLLGGDEALRELLDAAHARGMRVVLDGVFNHASRGFWPFHHLLENGEDSPYRDWFVVHGWPLRPYHSDAQHPANYEAWWGMPALPKLNTRNPGVRECLLEAGRRWIEFGADGWRLDVPNEIDDDDFWRAFRQTVKAANPEAYICGEIWGEARRWLRGDQFDGVMNYGLAKAAIAFFAAETMNLAFGNPSFACAPLDAAGLAGELARLLALYDWRTNRSLLNLLNSHDTPRLRWLTGGDPSALRLCVLFQMTLPGAPCVYYGDEIGLDGGPDPHCRGAFPWADEAGWDHALLAFYRAAIALRRAHPVLRTGALETVHAEGGVLAFRRREAGDEALVAFNAARTEARVAVALPDAAAEYRRVWPPGPQTLHRAQGGTLHLALPPRQAAVLVAGAADGGERSRRE